MHGEAMSEEKRDGFPPIALRPTSGDGTPLTLGRPSAKSLRFVDENGTRDVLVLHRDGRVEIGAHLTPDEAGQKVFEILKGLWAQHMGPLTHLDKPHFATLPDGSRVELPAGTLLREDARPAPVRLASEAEERAVLARAAGVKTREDMSGRRVVVTDHEGQRYELTRVASWEAVKAVHGPYVPMYQRHVVTSAHPTTEREIQERRLQELREGAEKGASADSGDVSQVPSGKSAWD